MAKLGVIAAALAAALVIGPVAHAQASDADPDGGAPSPSVEELQSQLDDQQAQIDALRQDLDQARQNTAQLGSIDDGIQTLNAQVADGQAEVDARAQDRDARIEQLGQAIEILRQVNLELAVGTADVDDDLADAEDLLTGPTRNEVRTARLALGEGDLYTARLYVLEALNTGSANALQGTGRATAQP